MTVGDREVLDDNLEEEAPETNQSASDAVQTGSAGPGIIDHMIERMQREQDERILAAGGEILLSPTTTEPLTSPLGSPRASTSAHVPSTDERGASTTNTGEQVCMFYFVKIFLKLGCSFHEIDSGFLIHFHDIDSYFVYFTK